MSRRDTLVIVVLWFAMMCGIAYLSWRDGQQLATVVTREVVRAESVFVTDTVRLRAVLTRWDTVRATDTVVVNNVVYVPRTIVDSIVAACRPLPTSCESLVTAVRDSARAVRDRAWQSVGLTWPAGLYYERDLSQFRGGVMVGLDREGRVRGELRAGVRWE